MAGKVTGARHAWLEAVSLLRHVTLSPYNRVGRVVGRFSYTPAFQLIGPDDS